MCEYCEKPNKTILRHLSGVETFVGSGHLFMRFYDKTLDKTWLTSKAINYCPMCGRNLKER